MKANQLSVRKYGTAIGDYQTVNEWWTAHRGNPDEIFPETMLPPLGRMVERGGEPVACMFCYQAYDIGVGIVDWVVSRPGQSVAEAKEALLFGLEALAAKAREHGYGVLMTYTLRPIARVLERQGWLRTGERIQLLKTI